MPTTSNFGWTTPADTDLVKDGAAAIRTLGNGIDTSFLDLKGGTTGQVLSKASNTDLDFSWVAQDDADAIQKSLIDAEGDLIVGDAADAVQRLAIGSNGNVLTVDTSVDGKIKWATPASTTYTSYTPSFTGFTLGNGTVDTGYITLDQLIIYHGVITFGTTSSFSGTLRVSVPSNIKSEGGNGAFFIPTESATFSDASASLDFPLHVGGFSATNIAFISPTVSTYLRAAAANYVEGTIPVAWAANDQISWTYTYRKA